MRRVPIVSTVIVIAAILTMIGLGVWQLERLQWKQNLMAHYVAAMANPAAVPFPSADPQQTEAVLFRRASVNCRFTSDWNSISGRNGNDQAGYVHVVLCGIEGNKTAYVQAGWTQGPQHPEWKGGEVSGLIAPYIAFAAIRYVTFPQLSVLCSIGIVGASAFITARARSSDDETRRRLGPGGVEERL